MELGKAYEAKTVEARRYEQWMSNRLFEGVPGEGRPYGITIPPPNITGSLHIGHALNNSVIDCLIRWRRMCGDAVMCLPGTDHAGIATQAVVERQLAADGTTRHDLGREAFVERCWQWREQYGDRIMLQFRKLGCSYDWSRTRFTMDETYVEAIYGMFLRWWERGLIYRGARVVNWCPRCASAISDIEVSPEDRSGHLYHIRYPVAGSSEGIVVATTRPETMLGDAAVAVNPDDARYARLVGRDVTLPLTDRMIPVIADQYAKIEFGTGAVKVTPSHDLDDFEAGLRHRLPQITVIGPDGTMTEAAGRAYAGLDRFECRRRVLADLEREGLLVKQEPYTIKTPLCDRCKTVLEPLLSEQWFARQTELAEPAVRAVREGRIRFHPQRYERIFLDWMGNIRDWCISRQLWWGHRIPVWWAPDGSYAAGRSAEDAAQRLGAPVEDVRQDEDVLDTWFSSALWPHATLGWPRDTPDLRFWYPTALLSTAQEILYLWVARMIMTGLDFVGDIPFRDVYIHATVLDAGGERMSKSKGNGVDPIDMIDKYGADALRFSLLQQAGMNQDFRFAEERVRLAGAFCNKLWNASRFVIGHLSEAPPEEHLALADLLSSPEVARCGSAEPGAGLPERWILSRLQKTIGLVSAGLASYQMDDSARAAYSFVWDDFCDWYVEAAKAALREGGDRARLTRSVLAHVLDVTLRMLHPMTPHITEELREALLTSCGHAGGIEASAMLASYPVERPEHIDDEAEVGMGVLMDVVRGIRNARAEFGVAPSAWVPAVAVCRDPTLGSVLGAATAEIRLLARLSSWFVVSEAPTGGMWVAVPVDGADVFVDLGAALDLAKERQRISKETEAVRAEIEKSNAKLSNPGFVEKAPPAIVEKEKELRARHEADLVRLTERSERLSKLARHTEAAETKGQGHAKG